MTDFQLLTEFRQSRSPQAFSMLVDRHIGWIYATARRRVRDEHLAHDVAQAVFLLLSENCKKIRDPDRLSAWLLQTTVYASNHAIREESRRRKRERIVATAHTEAEVAEDRSILSQQVSLVEEAVGKLKEADRSLITVRFYQGRSLADLGAELGISPEAARKRLDRALQRLRERLGGEAFANSLGTALAAITSSGAAGPLNVNSTVRATSRAISISKGVSHMLLRNRIRKTVAMTCITLAVGAGAVLAFHNPSQQDNHAALTSALDASTSASHRRSIIIPKSVMIASDDGSKLTGYSKISGKWAQVDGKGFSIDGMIGSGDVMLYHSDERCYGYSPTMNTWDIIDLPHPLDPQSVVGPAVSSSMAAIAVPGFVYAYTPATGKWTSLATVGDKPAVFVVDTYSVTVEMEGKLYYCDATTGKWTPGF
jgi:RNA polymerase sigma factor (sigma-70 family)